MSLFSRTDRSLLGQWWWTVDKVMLACVLVLVIAGLMLVATASPPVAERIGLGSYHFFIRHAVMVVPALVLLFGLSFFNHQYIRRFATLLFIGSIAAMILVMITGMEIKGAKRWLHVFGFSLQPSEFIKPAFILMAAWLMGLQKTNQAFPGNSVAAGLYVVTITLLMLQPDFGMTFVVTACWAVQIFLAGFPFRLLLLLMVLAVGGGVLAYLGFDHIQSRIDRYLNPASGDNFQVNQSLGAFQNGGFWGTGPGQGQVKLGLPDAHADFIFSVAGEEMGLVFVAVLIGLYGFILYRGFNRLIRTHDMFVILSVGGLLSMFGLQALVHMGSALQLLPTKGMTLPFISYGGSSLLSMGLSFGMILALTRGQTKSGVSKSGLSLQSARRAG